MEVITKFNLGQSVWIVDKRKIKVFTVESVSVYAGKDNVGYEFYYYLKNADSQTVYVPESEIFGTSKELLTYLASTVNE